MSDQPTLKPVSELTDDELQREIFDSLGYLLTIDQAGYWVLWYPDGNSKRAILMQHIPQDKVFADLCAIDWIPNWPQDTGAAVEDLLIDGHLLLRPSLVSGYVVQGLSGVGLTGKSVITLPEVYAEHRSAARAICEAWVSMMRAQT